MKQIDRWLPESGKRLFVFCLTAMLIPTAGNAVDKNQDDVTQLRRELDALRQNLETKNEVIKMLTQGMESLEKRIRQTEARSKAEEERVVEVRKELEQAATKKELEQVATGGAWETNFFTEKPDHFWGGQVWFNGGYMRLENARTDSALVVPSGSDDVNGWNVGTGFNLPLMKLFKNAAYGGSLLGEVWINYAETHKTKGILEALGNPGIVVDVTGDGAGDTAVNPKNLGLAQGTGLENVFTVAVAPKYRFDYLGNLSPALANVRPWIIPAGITFQVNTPVDQAITNIAPSGVSGVGAEYLLFDGRISVGADARYYWGPDIPDTDLDRWTLGGYVGVNF